MNKKEIAEIKKQFTQEKCTISRICGCYVDGEKEIRSTMKEAFLSFPEEEMLKYFELLRKNLSGSIGKNLIDMTFPLSAEAAGGPHKFMMKLRDSYLKDDDLLMEFYQKIIEHYDYVGSFLILLIDASYDVPGKSSAGDEMFDASDEVYHYLLCSICPVTLTKPGLCYFADEGIIRNRIRDWLVEMPDVGFLFPAFNDRSTDIHGALFYSKNADLVQSRLAEDVLGCTLPLPAKMQKNTFNAFVEETLGEECTFENVRELHEKISEMAEEKKDDPEPLEFDRQTLHRLFSYTGASDENLEYFDQHFDHHFEEHDADEPAKVTPKKPTLLAANVMSTRKFEVKTPDVVISVKPERASLIETKTIDGRKYIMIPMDEYVEVNGICVTPGAAESTTEMDIETGEIL